MKKAVLIGGFTETERSLQPVADEMIEQQLAGEVEIIEFNEAMDDIQAVGKAVKDLVVYTHSTGIMALRSEHQPEKVVVYAGPEPMKVHQARGRAVLKTLVHGMQLHKARNRRMVWESTKSLLTNIKHNRELADEIINFSTLTALKTFKQNNIEVVTVLSEDDEFFKPNDAYIRAFDKHKIPNVTIHGKHDELLLDPKYALEALKHLEARELSGPSA